MNDPEIRALLYPLLTEGVYIDELPTGTTRADVVHITPQFMHGYEVKGDGDTLLRVAKQLPCYTRAYDFVTFVVTEKHLPKLLPLLPEWVGILVASPEGLRPHRPASYNATVERAAVAGLLRLSEVKAYLFDRGLHHVGLLRRRDLSHLLATAHSIPLSGLAQFVRDRLMARLPQRLQARAERKAERQQRPARARKRSRKPTVKRKRAAVTSPRK
ncbi:sce7726 family protein [Hymenobacter busanensis]|uniref:Sce7726 family protein n=1 Tax=Hymenobacter busanensis TaxID=2607656 RepID=A0A7L5A013_9BACT|nr:sce7726 family protein [Hymenobacter busanensis]KAA9338454.1 sce7726 family protein [Hymenobacter busanensis]QHJ09119.1 sce7726 family protein [Hymenobacter busanensis]